MTRLPQILSLIEAAMVVNIFTKLIAAASNGATYASSAEFTYTRTW